MFDITGTTGTLAPVTGSVDSVAPVEGLFEGLMHIYEESEIYNGSVGEDKFVPKVGDMTINRNTGGLSLVVDVNETTYRSTLASLTATEPLDDIQRRHGYSSADTFRLYINTNTQPHTAVVNKRLTVGGSQTSHAILYKGMSTGQNGVSISEVYDNNGDFETNRIPLELIENEMNQASVAIRAAMPFKISQDLEDGEIVTIVYFNDAGHVVHKTNLIVENTSYVNEVYGSLKFIESIEVVTPFLDKNTPNAINKLLATPISALNLRLVVNYSDGSKSTPYPLSSPEFDLIGLEAADNITIPSTTQVMAKYTLKADEAVAGVMGDGSFITREYDMNLTTT